MVTWKEQYSVLWKLIKQISDSHGKDDPIWLDEYFKLLVKEHTRDLDVPIAACKSVIDIHG
jgi:hypothetical protein